MLLFCRGKHGPVHECVFFLTRPIKILICCVVVVVAVVDAKAP